MKDATAANRDVLEVQLMKNVLFIAYNNVGNLSAVNTYFDQSFIRRDKEKTFSGPVPTSSSLNADHRTYDAAQVITVRNPGATALNFCLAASAGDSCPGGVTLNPGEEKTVTASMLGDVTVNHFLNVTNINAFDGEYNVSVEL